MKAIEQHRKFSLFDKLIVIDDNGDFPLNIELNKKEQIFYSDTWLGVAGARNKGLELLEDCRYTFIMDDDIFPKASGWVENYIMASQYAMDRQLLLAVPKPWASVIEYCGPIHEMNRSTATLMLFTPAIRAAVGGFDTTLGKYGHEDTDLFYRAECAGFMDFGRYCTIKDCEKYLHLCDINGDFDGLKWPHKSALGENKHQWIKHSGERLSLLFENGNSIYKPYK